VIYYNEFDPKDAAWLWELIDMGMIGRGIVDDRSIIDVDYRDLYGFDQHHFFAGIGGWSYALRLAGWPDDRAVWTASLPCQPFSAAGKGLGKADERHLLPHFLELVKQCRPDVIFGEQVERAIAHGWLDDLQATMEAENYAVGHCVLGAHSIGAAHIRQRLYWVADSYKQGLEGRERTECTDKFTLGENGLVDRVGISNSAGSQQRIEAAETARYRRSVESAGDASRMGNAKHNGSSSVEIARSSLSSGINSEERPRVSSESQGTGRSSIATNLSRCEEWQWLECRDGKLRPIEPGILPLAHGVPRGMVHSSDTNASQEARKMRLHGYGNAIVPQVAAEFINAYMSI